jgi:hypothetical protein
MMKAIAPNDVKKIKQQIAALESVLKTDTNEKDRVYHQMTLKELQQKLQELEK